MRIFAEGDWNRQCLKPVHKEYLGLINLTYTSISLIILDKPLSEEFMTTLFIYHEHIFTSLAWDVTFKERIVGISGIVKYHIQEDGQDQHVWFAPTSLHVGAWALALDLWTDPYEGKVGVGQVSSSLDLKTVKNAVNGSELGKYIIEVLFFNSINAE